MSVYCSADWHGCGYLADKVFDFLKPDDILYFLGDAIDRGPDGLTIFQKLTSDPRIKYIKGNHEQMMSNAIEALYMDTMTPRNIEAALHLWDRNGGNITHSSFSTVSKEEILSYKRKIDKMPTELIYSSPFGHTFIMEHAGYSPFDQPHRHHDPLWDRHHFYDEWFGNWGDRDVDPAKVYLVHGHTPTMYLKYHYGYNGMSEKMTEKDFIAKRQFFKNIILDGEEIIKPEIIRYCSGHKFDIDLCTIVSNRIALLNLDTFEVIYFDAD